MMNVKSMLISVMTIMFSIGAVSSFAQAWSKVAGGIKDDVNDYAVFDGDLYVSVGGIRADNGVVMMLSGSKWVDVGSKFDEPGVKLEVLNSELFAAMTTYDDALRTYESEVFQLVSGNWVLKTNVPYAADFFFSYKGQLTIASSSASDVVVTWDGTKWTTLGDFNDGISDVEVLSNQLVCMGGFDKVNGVNVDAIASWNGSAWSNMSTKFDFHCDGFGWSTGSCIDGNNLFISDNCIKGLNGVDAAEAPVYSWDGTSWTDTKLDGPKTSYKMIENKGVVLGLARATKGKSVYEYDGASWSEVIVSSGDVDTMFVSEIFVFDNELYAIGSIYDVNFAQIGIVKMSVPTSTQVYGSQFEWSIYPNPTQEAITINVASHGIFHYWLTNVNGQHCGTGTLTNNSTVSLKDMPKGIYFIYVSNLETQTQSIQKVVKQ